MKRFSKHELNFLIPCMSKQFTSVPLYCGQDACMDHTSFRSRKEILQRKTNRISNGTGHAYENWPLICLNIGGSSKMWEFSWGGLKLKDDRIPLFT